MLADFTRDALFTTAWFGLMAVVWFGWAQEDPPPRARIWLGAGSAAGAAFAVTFGVLTGIHWDQPSALAGKYPLFGILTAIEVLGAGAGAFFLARSGRGRWTAWWVAVVVGAHFLPLAWLLGDLGLAVFGALQLGALGLLWRVCRTRSAPTSRVVGPVMGLSLLGYAAISTVVG